jgi:hypothetical protein
MLHWLPQPGRQRKEPPVKTSRARRLLLAAPLLLGGCTFSYDNPAQDLGTGEVAGRVVYDASGGTVAGEADVRVELRNSFNVVTTRDSGRYFLFGMMPGRHTLLFSKAPGLALQRDVEMAFGADGQPEGVILGDLRLRRAVTLQGRVLAPATPPGYTRFAADLANVLDDATGQSQQVTPFTTPALGPQGDFDFALSEAPTGPHLLRVAISGTLYALVFDAGLGIFVEQPAGQATFVAGPVALDVPDSSEGLKLDLTDLTPVFPTPGATGKLRFRVAVAGASSAGGFAITVNQLPLGIAPPIVPVPDSTGTCELDLPPGLFRVDASVLAGTGSLIDPPPGNAVVVEAQTSELGTFYAVDTAILSASAQACLDGADCHSGACQGGQCLLVACLPGDFTSDCALAASDCARGIQTPCGNGQGFCAGSASAPACVPKGAAACTGAAGGTATLAVCKPN